MLKKLAIRLGLIVIGGVLLFFICYFLSYKIAANQYKIKSASQSAAQRTEVPSVTAAPVSEPDVTEAPVTAAPEEETEPPVSYDMSRLAEPREISMPEDETWSLVLINQFYKIKSGYEPFVEQVMPDSAVYLDQRVAEAYRAMYEAALSDGIELTLSAGYIAPDRQARMFEKQVKAYTDQGVPEETAQARAAFFVMPSGCSESNYGLSVDIGWPEDDFANTPAYGWLQRNAALFGFVERYTAQKTEITHFHPEPWHWRYVGVEAAKAMVENNQCLEEYVGRVN